MVQYTGLTVVVRVGCWAWCYQVGRIRGCWWVLSL